MDNVELQYEFIISGTPYEFLQWQSKQPKSLNKKYVFVSSVEVLRGQKNIKGKFIGSWIERNDLQPIFAILLLSVTSTEGVIAVKECIDRWNDYRREDRWHGRGLVQITGRGS